MKHIPEKRVLFYGVIVRTFWMTLVLVIRLKLIKYCDFIMFALSVDS